VGEYFEVRASVKSTKYVRQMPPPPSLIQAEASLRMPGYSPMLSTTAPATVMNAVVCHKSSVVNGSALVSGGLAPIENSMSGKAGRSNRRMNGPGKMLGQPITAGAAGAAAMPGTACMVCGPALKLGWQVDLSQSVRVGVKGRLRMKGGTVER
jgi:hypothetical protein